MAELVDALDSGSSEVKLMEVQILLAAPIDKLLSPKLNTLVF